MFSLNYMVSIVKKMDNVAHNAQWICVAKAVCQQAYFSVLEKTLVVVARANDVRIRVAADFDAILIVEITRSRDTLAGLRVSATTSAGWDNCPIWLIAIVHPIPRKCVASIEDNIKPDICFRKHGELIMIAIKMNYI